MGRTVRIFEEPPVEPAEYRESGCAGSGLYPIVDTQVGHEQVALEGVVGLNTVSTRIDRSFAAA